MLNPDSYKILYRKGKMGIHIRFCLINMIHCNLKLKLKKITIFSEFGDEYLYNLYLIIINKSR